MRILHVYRTFFPDSQGGLEETIKQICLSTREVGVESKVFTLSENASDEPRVVDGIEVHQAPLDLEIVSCSISLRCRRIFSELYSWADLVHYHYPWPFGDLLHLMQPQKKPSIVTYHSDIVRQKVLGLLYKPLMQRFLSSVDRIVCTSPNYFATSDTLVEFQDKVEVIPIGLDAATYPEASQSELEDTRVEFGQDFFLFIGVLRYYKGLHILLDAIKDAPYKVVVVGSGPTEADLRTQAQKLALDNVTFAGYVSNETKVALLRLCRGIVFPSYLRSEAFGVTLLEGAMFGRALISTEVGSGTSHVNLHNQTGLVIAPASKRSLRRALDQLHGQPDLAELMGRNARKRYEDLFTGQIMGARYAQVYRDVLSEPAILATSSEEEPRKVG